MLTSHTTQISGRLSRFALEVSMLAELLQQQPATGADAFSLDIAARQLELALHSLQDALHPALVTTATTRRTAS
jgi:hypothetical protein